MGGNLGKGAAAGEARPRAVLFSDPNCPFCYATEERLLALDLVGAVEWRGVEHAPHLPVPMADGDPPGEDLGAEVESIRLRAPEVEIALPPGKPKTEAAILLAAAALAADPVAGRRLVRTLYRALWRDGADLSRPEVLDALAEEAGLPPLRPDGAAAERVSGWRREWAATGLTGVPLLVRDDGRSLYGLVEPNQLREFLA